MTHVVHLETRAAVERWAHEASKVIAQATLEGHDVVGLMELFNKPKEEGHE